MKLKFKSSKRKSILKPVKLRFFNTSKFPKRSKAEWKIIDKNPFGDTDKDRVPNWFDCKPLNRKKQGKFSQNIPINEAKYITVYHGTQKENNPRILKEGLKTLKSQGSDKYKDNPIRNNTIYLSIDKSIAGIYGRDHPSLNTIQDRIDKQEKYNTNVYKVKLYAKHNHPNRVMFYKDDIPLENIKLLNEKEHKKFIHKASIERIKHLAKIPYSNKEGSSRMIAKKVLDEEQPETLQSLDTNDNQIPDMAEDVEPIEIKEEDED